MVEEIEELVQYEPHTELDEFNNKKTPISLASRFLNNIGSTTYQILSQPKKLVILPSIMVKLLAPMQV